MSENASNNNKASALIKRFNDLALLNTSNTATTANPSAQTSPLNIPLSPNKSTFPELTSPSTAALNPFKTTLNSLIQNTNAQSSISPLEFLKIPKNADFKDYINTSDYKSLVNVS
ncbi:hypothetical protein BB561_003603 [Smittium simulii]|uniref:Uncharacterized protein n=1 Tax=Smittium simulii TaxID=133385 RepID=A0A2T9YKG8_9FUNG|nr:hypothetical protein BB561_003603 [Smittium simulii]